MNGSDIVERTPPHDRTEENFVVVRKLLTATAALLQDQNIIVTDVEAVG